MIMVLKGITRIVSCFALQEFCQINVDKVYNLIYYQHMNNYSYVDNKEEAGDNLANNNVECCETFCVHKELQKSINEQMPKEEELYDLAELFKVFGDSTRIRILYVLFEAEVCVCDLADILNMTQSAISHQLKILKQAKLVKSRREGKSVFYSLADGHVRTIIDQGREHMEE